jgi:hypothetical protein
MYTLCAFSFGLVFLLFIVLSFHNLLCLTPREKNFEKRHTLRKEKEPLLRSSFFCCRSVRFYVIHTRARASLSLFSVSTKGRSRSSTRLSLDRRARVLVFIARKELERLYYLLPARISARARPKKSPKLREKVILLFL